MSLRANRAHASIPNTVAIRSDACPQNACGYQNSCAKLKLYWNSTVSIDPVTGKIIDQQVHDVRTLKDGGDTALDLTAEYTPETIQSNVDDAKAGGKQLTLITKTLPIVGLVVGLICLALGVFLLVRHRRRSSEPTEAPPAHAATPTA